MYTIQEINKMTDQERVKARKEMKAKGLPLPKNLFFNYETQNWIDDDEETK